MRNDIVKYNKRKELRREFIQYLVVELEKAKLRDASADLIVPFAEDTLRCLENEEDREHEINQSLIEMKELFHDYPVVVQEGRSANSNEYRVLNVIVMKKCAEFRAKCQNAGMKCTTMKINKQKKLKMKL